MTETKYILTGDEPHWTGDTIREIYCGVKFPRMVNYAGAGSIGGTETYSDVDDPLYKYHVNEGTAVEYVFKGESITIKPTYVNWDAAKSLFDQVDKPENYNTN